jgi:lipid-A-disaccharide synthase-like uncharacterized protein
MTAIIEFIKAAIMKEIVGDPIWAVVAIVGQGLFAGRFVVQWIASEIKKKSHVPTVFWVLSVVGSLILLCYSVHIKNPIFMLAFSLNTLIYIRNLHLIYNHASKGVKTAIDNEED